VVGRWKVTEVRTLRTEWDEVPLSAAFFAALALASWGLAAASRGQRGAPGWEICNSSDDSDDNDNSNRSGIGGSSRLGTSARRDDWAGPDTPCSSDVSVQTEAGHAASPATPPAVHTIIDLAPSPDHQPHPTPTAIVPIPSHTSPPAGTRPLLVLRLFDHFIQLPSAPISPPCPSTNARCQSEWPPYDQPAVSSCVRSNPVIPISTQTHPCRTWCSQRPFRRISSEGQQRSSGDVTVCDVMPGLG
jgi:hypothetical protein